MAKKSTNFLSDFIQRAFTDERVWFDTENGIEIIDSFHICD